MPGLGVSVAASRHYGPALRQWDEAAAGEAEAAAEESGGKQPGLGARLVRLLNLRREEVGELPPGEAGKEGGQEEERPAAGPCPRPGRCRDHQGGACRCCNSNTFTTFKLLHLSASNINFYFIEVWGNLTHKISALILCDDLTILQDAC